MDPRRPDDFQPKIKEKKGKDDDTGLGLEKKDIPALVISALLVFGPIFLVLILILVLLIVFVL